ncbi:hypothetical protein MRS44_015016 [Fusarium solani]|uniref:uncharacterized protein n=1 Tax=Fusarium solani TaxID=169388 RepID=UPI0032C3FE40|nr:hypothetical protein MRS44_015016 [Fusarium solani]
MYTPTPSWNSTTFCTFCQLHELTTEMMLLFSNTPSTEDFATNINDLDARFRTWYDEMPPSLKISDVGSLQQSPPPHIISLNLLYHALHILLRRPFLSSRDSTLRASSTSPLWSGDRSSSSSSGVHRQPHPAADGESDGLSRTRTHLGPEASQPFAGDISSAREDISAFTIGQDCSWWDQTGYTGLDTGAGFHPDSFSWGMANVLPQTLNILPLPDQGWNAYGSMG